MEEKIAKENMIESLIKLQNAWSDVSECFNNNTIDCNDYICDGYPFEKSFDDINIFEWINNSIDNLQKQ